MEGRARAALETGRDRSGPGNADVSEITLADKIAAVEDAIIVFRNIGNDTATHRLEAVLADLRGTNSSMAAFINQFVKREVDTARRAGAEEMRQRVADDVRRGNPRSPKQLTYDELADRILDLPVE